MESAARLDALVSDLLEFGRLGHGDTTLTPVHPETLVSNILADLAFQIQQSHAAITVDSPLLPVMAHPRPLYLVLLNLISNALKFVRPGTAPEVRVRTDALGDKVKLWVEDKGIGFPSDQAERIFKIFERLEDERFQGHGLGLAIAQKAVTTMGGQIGAISEPGQGARFWILLQRA